MSSENKGEVRKIDEIIDERIYFGKNQFKVRWIPEDEYEVDEIIKERKYKTIYKYKVRWKGCEDIDPDYYSVEDISNCKAVMGDFIKKRYSFIKEVGLVDSDEDDSDEDNSDTNIEWVSASRLKDCNYEMMQFRFKNRNRKLLLGKIEICDVVKYENDIRFRVKYSDSTEQIETKDVLKDKYPEIFLNYLEEHIIFIEHSSSSVKEHLDSDNESIKEENYKVENICDKRINDQNMEYLVKKKDVNEADSSLFEAWIPIDKLFCFDLIEEFELKNCKGLTNNWKLSNINDIIKFSCNKMYVKVKWEYRLKNKQVEENEVVLYEIIKKEYPDQLINFFLKNVVENVKK